MMEAIALALYSLFKILLLILLVLVVARLLLELAKYQGL